MLLSRVAAVSVSLRLSTINMTSVRSSAARRGAAEAAAARTASVSFFCFFKC